MSEQVNGRKTIISKDTLVPISLVVIVSAFAFSLATSFVWLKTSLYSIEAKVASVEAKIDGILREGVSQRDVQSWIRVLKAQNPTINVPDL